MSAKVPCIKKMGYINVMHSTIKTLISEKRGHTPWCLGHASMGILTKSNNNSKTVENASAIRRVNGNERFHILIDDGSVVSPELQGRLWENIFFSSIFKIEDILLSLNKEYHQLLNLVQGKRSLRLTQDHHHDQTLGCDRKEKKRNWRPAAALPSRCEGRGYPPGRLRNRLDVFRPPFPVGTNPLNPTFRTFLWVFLGVLSGADAHDSRMLNYS